MNIKIIEAMQGVNVNANWGKFMLMQFDETEWRYQSVLGGPLLRQIGWNPHQVWVLDLQTCEGVAIVPGGLARADLNKHQVWVCPMFEPFLEWLYKQDASDLSKLPAVVELPDAEFQMSGHRRGRK